MSHIYFQILTSVIQLIPVSMVAPAPILLVDIGVSVLLSGRERSVKQVLILRRLYSKPIYFFISDLFSLFSGEK